MSKRQQDDDNDSNSTKTAKTLDPILAAKQMTEWQQAMTHVEQRDNYIMENDMFCDCSFTFGEGENITEVKCHRVYLAKTSSVFSSMLFGGMKETAVHLPEVNLEAFLAMRQYIYSGRLDLKNYKYEEICGLLYIAKKYLLPDEFLKQIRGHLWRHIYPDNVWMALEFANSNDEPALEETAWKVLEKRFLEVVSTHGFLDTPIETLVCIVQRDQLSCTEVELLQECLYWARHEAKYQGRGTEALREILAPVIPHIRFLAMKGGQFVSAVRGTNLLTAEEERAIAFNLLAPNSAELPSTICTSKIARAVPDGDLFNVISYPEESCELSKLNVGDYLTLDDFENTYSVFISFEYQFNIGDRIFGISYPNKIKVGESKTNDTYLDHQHILICKKVGDVREIIRKIIINKTSVYNRVSSVEFTDPITIEECKQLSIVVVILSNGYYMSNVSKLQEKIMDIVDLHTGNNIYKSVFDRSFKYIINCWILPLNDVLYGRPILYAHHGTPGFMQGCMPSDIVASIVTQ